MKTYTKTTPEIKLKKKNGQVLAAKISTSTDAAQYFRAAIESGATAIILAHNHPTGSLIVSDADKRITQKIKEGGNVLDIRLLDHIILTSDSFTSMADEGLI